MPVLRAEQAAALLGRGASARLPGDRPSARFAAGARVLARNVHPAGHTRLPRYVRGRRGVIARDHGLFVFPDAHAEGRVEAQRLYSVRFEAAELWGPQAEPGACVFLDLFEAYLDSAP